MSQLQAILILVGAVCLAGAVGIKFGQMTFRAMYLKPKVKFDFRTLFHKDAHPIGEHGTIYVDCPAKGWRAEPISFVFPDIPASPKMSLDLMKKVWYDAELAGYIPISLRSYNQIYNVVKPPHAPQAAISDLEQRIAEANRRKTEQRLQERAAAVDAAAFHEVSPMPVRQSSQGT